MKRVLILTPDFKIGGTNSSLLAFLEAIKNAPVKVDVFAFNQQGEYEESFRNYSIIQESLLLSSKIHSGGFIKRILHKVLRVILRMSDYIGLSLRPLALKIGGCLLKTKSNYDAVASFQESLSYELSHIPAKMRIAWIRSEYERYMKLLRGRDESGIYNRIDKIVCVSEFAKKSFCKVLPQFSNKVVVVHNCLDVQAIRKLASKEILDPLFETSVFTIVSLGRIDPVKQFDRIPSIAKEIVNQTNIDFRWYIIGGAINGNMTDSEKDLRHKIHDDNVEKKVIVLAQKENPFLYISKADLFVHTSKSETYSRVVNEAFVLGVPVLANNYDCAPEFIKEGINGYIRPVEQMASFIAEIIENPSALRVIRGNLNSFDTDNNTVINKFLSLLA